MKYLFLTFAAFAGLMLFVIPDGDRWAVAFMAHLGVLSLGFYAVLDRLEKPDNTTHNVGGRQP